MKRKSSSPCRLRLTDPLQEAAARLAAAGIENPRLEARLLWEAAEGASGHARGSEAPGLEAAFQMLLQRRCKREPLSQIVGKRAFWSLDFYVNIHTLTPRPDSETVVEAALAHLPKHLPEKQPTEPQHPLRLLDLGTGTGCLLLSLLHELPHATGLGIDRSPEALAVAKRNAETLALAAKAEFRIGNWAEGIIERFDMVVSNPPYIPEGDISALMPEVREWEPHLALSGGFDGLDAYRHLTAALPCLLKPKAHAVFEIGIGQAADVVSLGEKAGLTHVETRKDLSGIERAIVFTLN